MIKKLEGLRTIIKDKKEDELIDFICQNNNEERQKFASSYISSFGDNLEKEIKDNFSGDFMEAVIASFKSPIDYDCENLRNAMKGLGTNENTLIEIIAMRHKNVIKEITKRYTEIFKERDLAKDIESETSGDFQNLLISLLQGQRKDNPTPNQQECEDYVKQLYEAGEKDNKLDSPVWNKIFAISSPEEIKMIFQNYYKLTGHTILEAIEKLFSGDAKQLYTAVVYSILCPAEYFAALINKSIKGLGTDEKTLTRVIVSRSELDMPQIRQFYWQLYKKEMEEDIRDDTSGSYGKLLLKLSGY